MNIYMIGIDHGKASVEYRELFSFTKKNAAAFMKELKEDEKICGCVILSTCNRMEIWISTCDDYAGNLYEGLCLSKGVETEPYTELFVEREGIEAVKHLFYLTCGMKSMIIGEDQILTQVKDALTMSRENYCTDNVIEILFRTAITYAKKVKTNIHLKMADPSVIHNMLHSLLDKGIELKGKKCLVIGNGEMGKLAATILKENGAHVTVTIRQYKSGVVNIPEGCKRINYGDRIEHIRVNEIIISATASPNVTIKAEYLKDIILDDSKIFIDLAVPRDIEPEVGNLPNVQLYNIDSFRVDACPMDAKSQMEELRNLLWEGINEFVSWYDCREIIPNVQTICEEAATDMYLRLEKKLKQLDVEEEQKRCLDESIKCAAKKAVNKMLFGLRDNVDAEVFRECVEAIQKIY